MKSHLRPFLVAVALLLPAIPAFAQAPIKVMVVDMVTLLNEHPNTAEQNAKLTAEQDAATADLDKMQKEVNQLVEDYKKFDEQSKNPTLNDTIRAKAASDAKDAYAKIQAKNTEGVNYRDQFTAAMQKRIQNYRDLMFEEIGKVAGEIAKKKGATLLLDKSGATIMGTLAVVYSDPSYDITAEVLAEINRTKPATPVTAPAATPASPAAAKK
jgi:outer membrane protein